MVTCGLLNGYPQSGVCCFVLVDRFEVRNLMVGHSSLVGVNIHAIPWNVVITLSLLEGDVINFPVEDHQRRL